MLEECPCVLYSCPIIPCAWNGFWLLALLNVSVQISYCTAAVGDDSLYGMCVAVYGYDYVITYLDYHPSCIVCYCLFPLLKIFLLLWVITLFIISSLVRFSDDWASSHSCSFAFHTYCHCGSHLSWLKGFSFMGGIIDDDLSFVLELLSFLDLMGFLFPYSAAHLLTGFVESVSHLWCITFLISLYSLALTVVSLTGLFILVMVHLIMNTCSFCGPQIHTTLWSHVSMDSCLSACTTTDDSAGRNGIFLQE